jgi:hypothetical protein
MRLQGPIAPRYCHDGRQGSRMVIPLVISISL